ncbi:S-phase kinase-associated protein 1-like [Erinaceus europaeus]|uniref:S-phase kinase-associated protein 1-like n=1 Tax=Erinaceus europaeus TaxID=9365 RepID=A0ABM3X0Y2_ERIEU|nr:S-phase kinase-associated protein 1-like [Erinaceus europaeus]
MYRLLGADVEIAKQYVTIKIMLEDLGMDDEGDDDPIPLPNVNAAILKKVIQCCTHHKDDTPPPEDDENKEKQTDDIPVWDQEFLKVDQGTSFELILAANYLDIKGLLDVTCKSVASIVEGEKDHPETGVVAGVGGSFGFKGVEPLGAYSLSPGTTM